MDRTLDLAPQRPGRRFRTFFSTAGAYGTLTLTPSSLRIDVVEGRLDVDRIRLTRDGRRETFDRTIVATPGRRAVLRLK